MLIHKFLVTKMCDFKNCGIKIDPSYLCNTKKSLFLTNTFRVIGLEMSLKKKL